MIIPPALKTGDTIGIVATTLPMAADKIALATEKLKSLGFKPVIHPSSFLTYGGFAGTDKQRADALLDYLNNDDIHAIMFMGGFYGSARLFDHMDERFIESVQKKPKLLIGYSDTNFLLHYFHRRAGLISIHGPLFSSFAKDTIKDETFADFKALATQLAQPRTQDFTGTTALQTGQANGKLIAGNLAVLQYMAGTPEDYFEDGCILFLEDTADEIDSVERTLIQMQRMGRLERANAIIFGDMHGLRPAYYDFPDTLETIYRRVLPKNKPAAFNFPFGHGPYNTSLPIGVQATVTVQNGTVSLTY